jgi:membrane dipeptidase
MKKISLLLFTPLLVFFTCSENITEKAARIHEEVLTIDTHCDTPLRFMRGSYDPGVRHDSRKGGGKVDFVRMKEGSLDAQFFAAYIGQGERSPEAHEKAVRKIHNIIDSIYAAVNRYADLAEIATEPEDAYRLENENKRAIYIGIENGYGIGKDISLIKKYYDKGVRYITLCHTGNNEICDSSNDTTEHNGLSNFGREVIKEMNRVGMIVDVSHISDKSFFDVIELSKTPVIASHSCTRALCDNPRNMTDEMLLKLKENGGVIQMCIYSGYVKELQASAAHDSASRAWKAKYPDFRSLPKAEKEQAEKEWYAFNRKFPAPLATVSDAVDHIDHIVKLIGIDHVGIGTDFDGGGALKDCFDVSEMGNITLELIKRGYTKGDIQKIWGENFMRVFRQVQSYAGK